MFLSAVLVPCYFTKALKQDVYYIIVRSGFNRASVVGTVAYEL